MIATHDNTAALTIPERITHLLKANHPNAYCDDCIANALNMRREQVNTVTCTLGLCREYRRGTETCCDCGRSGKFAINYLKG
jgi:hypothetical protein